MAGPAWTSAETTELRRRHAEGESLNAVAKAMGRSKSTIGKHAKAAGISFADPVRLARTRAATEVAQVSNAERRQQIISRLYARSFTIMDRLDAPQFSTLVRGEGGAQKTRVLDFVPPEDERSLTGAATSLLSSAARLEAVPAEDHGKAQASLLRGLAAGLGLTDAADSA